MTLTIHLAATYHSSKIGAFAFWMVCSQGRVQVSAPLQQVSSLLECEYRGLGKALYSLYDKPYTGIDQIIILGTDIARIKMVEEERQPDVAGAFCKVLLGKLRQKYPAVSIQFDLDSSYKTAYCAELAEKILEKQIKT